MEKTIRKKGCIIGLDGGIKGHGLDGESQVVWFGVEAGRVWMMKLDRKGMTLKRSGY